MFKLFQRLALIYIFIFLLLIVLVVHVFRPELVNVDRYTIILFGLLFIVSILPSLQSGKISYFFEFQRDLKQARESIRKLKEQTAVDRKSLKKIKQEAEQTVAGANACFTCGWLRQKIYFALSAINDRLPPEERQKTKDLAKLLKHLNIKKKLDQKMYQAAKDVLRLCDSTKPFEEMDDEDTRAITKIALPLLQYLEKIS